MIQEATKLLLTCTFNMAAYASLPPHPEAPYVEPVEPAMVLRYLIEDGSDTGTMMGNLGPTDVAVIWGPETVSLLEVTSAFGTPTVTTVDIYRGPPLSAVHSRHSVIEGLVPSQFYGSCIGQ